MIGRIAATLALAALAAGCTTTRYNAKLPSTAAMACTGDFADIARQPLRPLDAKASAKQPFIEFADIAQCYRNGDASTPLALYAFEGVTVPAEAKVSVLLSTGGTFAAAVDVLDARFKPLQHHGFEAFVRRGDEYSLTLFLNESDPAPAYLMLAPDPAQIGKKDVAIGSVSSPVVIPAGPVMFVYNNGSETSAVREFLSGGKLRVTVKPQANVSFGGK